MSRIFSSLRWAVGLLLVCASAAAETPRTDVRVLIDVSGSMVDNDPANLRVPALALLVGLLPPDTVAGIWTFAERPERQVAPAVVDPAWKQSAGAAAAAIHSRGQRTDIEQALRTAASAWEEPPGETRRSIILLTDGVVDTGSEAASRASRSRLLAEGVGALEQAGAAVHAIALSAHADHELLKQLAVATDGWYERAEDAGQLERLFLRMFEKATQPDTVPIAGNRFSVDDSIDEMTVLVFREQEAPPMKLHAPDGSTLTTESAGDHLHWRSGSGYDMVTLGHPQTGEWTIEGETDPDNRVMVVTDLRLEVADLPGYVLPGEDLLVAASLSEGGTPIDRTDFLRLVGMSTLQHGVDGDRSDLIMMDDGEAGDAALGDGVFSVTVGGGEQEGVMYLDIIADSGTFIRESRQSVGVLWPASARLEDGERPVLRVTPQSELLQRDGLRVEATFTPAGGSSVALELTPDADGDLVGPMVETSAGGHIEITVHGRATSGRELSVPLPPIEVAGALPPAAAATADGAAVPAGAADAPSTGGEAPAPGDATTAEAPAQEETAPEAAAEPPPPPPDWGVAIGLAAAANLVAALIVGGLWWWRRRRDAAQLQGFEAALAPAA